LDTSSEKLLDQLSPKGELSDLHVRYQGGDKAAPRFLVSSNFKGLSVRAYKHFPGVADLDGKLWTNQQHGAVSFADSSLQLDLPSLFRKSFDITRLEGTLQWWHAYDAWHVNSPELAFESKDVQTNVAVNLSIPDNHASPFLDLQAHFANGDVQQTWRYLPVSIMDNDLVKWVDRSVVDGHVKGGSALFHGRLHDFPFREHPGTFVVDFQVQDALLDYRKGWPSITANELEAHFTGKGMSITVPRGKLFNTQLRNTSVTIDDFRLPVLSITGKFNGEAEDAVHFLVESPIAPAATSFYKQSQISGGMNGALSLSIPLSNKAGQIHPISYQGFVSLKNANLNAWQNRLMVNNISGRLNYSMDGVFSDKLHGRFSGQPIQFNVFTRDAGQHSIIELSMLGTLDVTKLSNQLPPNGLEKRISGKTPWQGILSFGSDDPADPKQVSLQITSQLAGIGFGSTCRLPYKKQRSPRKIFVWP